MSKALMKTGNGSAVDGVVPAVGSAFVPGLGQLINGETDKAIGVFVVASVCGVGFVTALPIIGAVATGVGALTWIYGVADGYIQGRKKR